ncbi:hypothetical protein PR048_008600, partial [Dryococelus australis]
MTHPEIQNEVLEIFGHEIVKILYEKIRSNDPLMFSIVCDGTQDISGLEQESICMCWVDENFEPQENFLGFYWALTLSGIVIFCLLLGFMGIQWGWNYEWFLERCSSTYLREATIGAVCTLWCT